MPDNETKSEKVLRLGRELDDAVRRLPIRYYEIPEEMGVYDWCPTLDASGPATQVHVVFGNPGDVNKSPVFLIRFKSTESLDRLIDALAAHRESVFGKRG